MKWIIAINLLIFFSCRQNTPNDNFSSEAKQEDWEILTEDINNIIEVIILHDSIKIIKEAKSPDAVCSELRKVTIEIRYKEKDGSFLPSPPGSIYLHELINEKKFFSKTDSIYLLGQNSYPQKLKMKNSLLDKLQTISCMEDMTPSDIGKIRGYYNFSIPIFSLEKNTAYVERDYHCGVLCGYGKIYFLKKINGKWQIVEEFETWIS